MTTYNDDGSAIESVLLCCLWYMRWKGYSWLSVNDYEVPGSNLAVLWLSVCAAVGATKQVEIIRTNFV